MTTQVKVTQQPNISLKVANPQNKQVKQVAIGQVELLNHCKVELPLYLMQVQISLKLPTILMVGLIN